jgi:hypothetical protein
MTRIIDTKPKRRLSTKLAAGLAISAFLLLGTFVASASAGNNNDHHWNNNNYNYNRGYGWSGNYYAGPPVVYGTPYYAPQYAPSYYPPPVVYGPGIGINLPGVNIGIQ